MRSKKRTLDDGIMAIAGNICGLASKAVASYSQEVEDIIASGCKDKRCIETVLDGMLDFCWDKNMLELYRELCRYYYGIDPQATAGYVYAYRDMWDAENSRTASAKLKNLPLPIEQAHKK